MSRLLVAAVSLVCGAPEAQGEAVKSIRLVFPPQPTPVVEHIGRVFTRQVQSRCEARVVRRGKAPLVVELAVGTGIGTEGYEIADGAKGKVRIVGNDERGLLYGVGKFLHTSTYSGKGFTPGSWRGVSVPAMPVRGMYMATHFENYYQSVPIDEVRQYVEDLSLWGVNTWLVWFGQEAFNGFDDPKAQAQIARLRALLKTAKDLGLNVSLGSIGNDGYANSPEELRATMVQWNLGHELCPSKPGVMELQLQFAREKFDAFKSIGMDYWFVVPYDNGGCGCGKCSPWGTRGFLTVAEPVARAFRSAFPNGKVIMSTWYFSGQEWKDLKEKFDRQKPDWLDYIMCDDPSVYPRKPLDKGSPGGLPLLNFPEISMWGQGPWGGYGANPFPGRLQARWNAEGKYLSGGFPYSEGTYDDINKVVCAQFYWSPDQSAMETIRQYTAFEFSPEVVDDVASVVRIFERNHNRDSITDRGNIDVSAITAYQLMEQANAKLTPQARRSWRWRLLYIRAMIDQELYRDDLGKGRNEVFRQAYDELIEITRTENAWHMMRPQLIQATTPEAHDPNTVDADKHQVDTEGPALAVGYAEAVADSKPVAWWRMKLVDGLYVEDASGHQNVAGLDKGVSLPRPGTPAGSADNTSDAADLHGGRMKGMVNNLGDSYSVEFWFYNTVGHTNRPVTGYFFARGAPGDNLGITGTSGQPAIPPGRLYYYNGDMNALKQAAGKAELTPRTWNHLLFVRDGNRIMVYLNGNAEPDMSGEIEMGYPDGLAQVVLGGRPDGFANFEGKIAEISVYDRALTGEEVVGHHDAAGRSK